MFTVTIEKECNCFKNSNYASVQHFESEGEALKKATEMAKEMTRIFCKNHAFSVIKEDENFLILLMS